MKDSSRNGTFSSSQVFKLIGNDKQGNPFGDVAKKYIKQVRYEIKLQRAINKDANPKPCTWGDLAELRAFELLGLKYTHVSDQRLVHPEFKQWTGAPDLLSTKTVSDVKSPFSMEVFCNKIEILQEAAETNCIGVYKKECAEDYWQHISNAILLEKNGFPVTHFEAIIYCPFKSELEEIRELANLYNGDQNKVAWINWATDDELPYINDNGEFNNLNIYRFAVPEEDKQFLTERVKQAINLLNKKDVKNVNGAVVPV